MPSSRWSRAPGVILGTLTTLMLMHLFGDAASPWLIGAASDRIGLRLPVVVTGCFLAVAGAVLLWGRSTLETDLSATRVLASTQRRA